MLSCMDLQRQRQEADTRPISCSPQSVRLPLLGRDRLADLVAEGQDLHVVGGGLALEGKLEPLPLALERTASAGHRRVGYFRRRQRADDRTLRLVGLAIPADPLQRFEIANLLEPRVGVERLENAFDLSVIRLRI